MACEAVAERIVDDLFLVLPTAMTLSGGQTPAARMPPENPRDPSPRPTLRWEPFPPRQPPTQDGVVAPDKVCQVTCELRLWGSGSSSPMYTRGGSADSARAILTPAHPIAREADWILTVVELPKAVPSPG
jgi:hypothetical protein